MLQDPQLQAEASFELGSVATCRNFAIAVDVAMYEAQIYLQPWTASFRSVPECSQAKPNLLGQCRPVYGLEYCLTQNVDNCVLPDGAEDNKQQPLASFQVDSFGKKQELPSIKVFEVKNYMM